MRNRNKEITNCLDYLYEGNEIKYILSDNSNIKIKMSEDYTFFSSKNNKDWEKLEVHMLDLIRITDRYLKMS